MAIPIKPQHEAAVLQIRTAKKGTASELGVSAPVIAKFVRDGVIETVGTKKGSRGRPANVYALTAEGRKVASNIARRKK